MAMTELEISTTLGVTFEPLHNRLVVCPLLREEICYMLTVFDIQRDQRKYIGTYNPDAWATLLPWYSNN